MRQPVDFRQQAGFTLIELLLSIAIGMVLLAGLYGVFIMQTRVQSAQTGVVESSEDLRTAAEIMESELRMAKEICWDAANKRVIYEPFTSTVSVGACSTVDNANGSFQLKSSDATHPTPYICWDQPNNASGCQEMVRNLSTTVDGLQVTPTGNGSLVASRTVTLNSEYQNYQRQGKDWSVSFVVWPRNQ